jgi:hypothetical protein
LPTVGPIASEDFEHLSCYSLTFRRRLHWGQGVIAGTSILRMVWAQTGLN